MAERIELVDDLDGSTKGVTTVTFAFDNSTYELELSERNEAALRKAFAPYVAAARAVGKMPKRKGTRRKASKPKATSRPKSEGVVLQLTPSQIREWAIEQGYEVSPKGRVPAAIVAEYEQAHA